MVVPVVVGNTRPLSCHREPIFSLFLALAGAVAPEGFCGLLRALYGPALTVLWLLELVSGSRLRERAPYVYRGGGAAEIYVVPPDPEQLALPESAMQGKHIQRRETVARAVRRGYQLAGLIRREWADLRFLRSGRLHARRHVAWNQTVAHGILECLVKRRVNVVDRAWGEPAIEFLRYSARAWPGVRELSLRRPKAGLICTRTMDS
jgi:hypothetical protein